ncbi:cell division protein ZapE [Rhodococcus sp. NPDC003322]
MSLAPEEVFDAAARRGGFALDPHQRAAAAVLSDLDPRGGRGIYLWGPVGRGKTWMIDVLRATLSGTRTLRVHFHDFFARLHELVHTEGIAQALDRMTGGCEVLFFDEFHVHDVADGVLLTRLLDTLDARGVALVLTSNYPPDGLMPNPLFHDAFLPTIDRLRRRLTVVSLDGGRDYRDGSRAEGGGFASGAYRARVAAGELPPESERVTLVPCGRPVTAMACRDGLVWFDFADLCEAPTGAADYLKLVADHRRWVVSGVPDIGQATEFGVARFCTLVDVLYDADVALTVIGADWRSGPAAGRRDLDRARSRLALLRQRASAGTSSGPVDDSPAGVRRRVITHPNSAATGNITTP